MTYKEQTIQRLLRDRNIFGTLRRTPEEYMAEAYDATLSQSAAQSDILNKELANLREWANESIRRAEKAESELAKSAARIEELEKELSESNARADKWSIIAQELGCNDTECLTLKERVEKAESENQALRQALRRYGNQGLECERGLALIQFVCWFSRKFFDIHDYKRAWGGDGFPTHLCTYRCWNCGKEFSI